MADILHEDLYIGLFAHIQRNSANGAKNVSNKHYRKNAIHIVDALSHKP
jgi:hypothetical protein